MPTYGKAETAVKHPLNPEAAFALGELERFNAQLALLRTSCDHHFVPQDGTLESLRRTSKRPDVVDAGQLVPWKDESPVKFTIVCTKCTTETKVALSEHCPVCASVMPKYQAGRQDKENGRESYFDIEPHSYYELARFECPCGFKAAGLFYDR